MSDHYYLQSISVQMCHIGCKIVTFGDGNRTLHLSNTSRLPESLGQGNLWVFKNKNLMFTSFLINYIIICYDKKT